MGNVGALMERARQQSALDDFGDDSFREGLDRVVHALEREARLTATGQSAMDAQITDLLVNRLQVEHWYARHPEIEDGQIVRPLIGLGLPRTGSTVLACLLGEDPAARSLRTWESMKPCPPPDAATIAVDPRVAHAEQAMARRAQVFPRMVGMLPSTATSPTECQLFMGYDFKSQLFQAFAHIPSYVRWLNHEADLVPTYRYVKRVLKLLQWRCPPNRWRLKNPSHSLFIDALDTVFPDARFVMTHRDVASVVPSVADLYFELRKAFSNDVDLHAIGQETRAFCELGMRRMMEFRDAGNEHRFFDIQFATFQADPFPSLSGLYEFLGEPLSEEARCGMVSWRTSKPLEAQTYARTDPGVFGLDPERLRDQFQFYSERFAAGVAAAGTGNSS